MTRELLANSSAVLVPVVFLLILLVLLKFFCSNVLNKRLPFFALCSH